MTIAVGRSDEQWLDRVVESVSSSGLAIVEGVLDDALIEECRSAMYAVQKRIQSDVGIERFDAAGEVGVLRLMLRYDDFFFRLLELPEVLDVVDATVSETAILHLQNGLILPPIAGDAPDVFQTAVSPRLPARLERLPHVDQPLLRTRRVQRAKRRHHVRPGHASGRGATVGCIPRGRGDHGDVLARIDDRLRLDGLARSRGEPVRSATGSRSTSSSRARTSSSRSTTSGRSETRWSKRKRRERSSSSAGTPAS